MRREYWPLYVRRAAIVCLILLTASLQNAWFSGSAAFLLIPMASAAAFFEKEFAGALFGLLCGALWDLASPAPDGLFALVFTAAACALGLLARCLFRSAFTAACVLHVGFTLVVSAAAFLTAILQFGGAASIPALLRLFFPRVLLGVLAYPVYYFIVKELNKKLAVRSTHGV